MSETLKKPDTLLIPFGEKLSFRSVEERMNEEVYSTIPALNELAKSSLTVANKLSQEARNALFFTEAITDPGLRMLKVELAMVKRDQAENAAPDLEWLAGQKPVARKAFESGDNDEWMPPAPGFER